MEKAQKQLRSGSLRRRLATKVTLLNVLQVGCSTSQVCMWAGGQGWRANSEKLIYSSGWWLVGYSLWSEFRWHLFWLTHQREVIPWIWMGFATHNLGQSLLPMRTRGRKKGLKLENWELMLPFRITHALSLTSFTCHTPPSKIFFSYFGERIL